MEGYLFGKKVLIYLDILMLEKGLRKNAAMIVKY